MFSKNLIILLFLLMWTSILAQNPYSVFGYKPISDTLYANQKQDSLCHTPISPTSLRRFINIDPLFFKYPTSTPYHFTDNNPVYRQEQDGMDWVISTTKDEQGRTMVHIVFTGAILNSSQNISKEDLMTFRNTVEAQIKEAYTQTFPKQTLKDAQEGLPDIASVNIDVNLRIINTPQEIKKNDHLIEILSADNKEWGTDDGLSYTAGRAGYNSNYVKINARGFSEIINSKHDHTVSHELGHTLGLKHHAESQNLMYAYTTSEQTEIQITPKQVAIALQNSESKNLNLNNIPYTK